MRLNLGAGPKNLPGYVNVDLYSEKPDVRADVRGLPFNDNSVDEAIFYHCIEHVNRDDGLNALSEIHRVLRPGGSVAIETPDRRKLIKLIQGRGPKGEGLNIVEGARAAQGLYYPNAPKLLDGVKGAMGGVSGTIQQKKEWHNWLVSRRLKILAALRANNMKLMPLPENVQPGEAHLYLWTAEELAAEMREIGFATEIQKPQSHGQRTWRDCRVVGVKL